jgi:hypothetical protein
MNVIFSIFPAVEKRVEVEELATPSAEVQHR